MPAQRHPHRVSHGYSHLMIGMQLRAGDIQVDPDKIKILTDPARVFGARGHPCALRKKSPPRPWPPRRPQFQPSPRLSKRARRKRRGRRRAKGLRLPRRKRRNNFSSDWGEYTDAPDCWPRQSRHRICLDAAQPGFPGRGQAGRAGRHSRDAAGVKVVCGPGKYRGDTKWFLRSRRR